jgi:hypothetical protein
MNARDNGDGDGAQERADGGGGETWESEQQQQVTRRA